MMTWQLFEPSTHLTFSTVESDRKRLLKLVQKSTGCGLRLDLSHVKLCDSAGLALLIEAKRLCIHFDKPFEIKRMPQMIHALAEFCGVETMLGQALTITEPHALDCVV